jgi:hypothetical protein
MLPFMILSAASILQQLAYWIGLACMLHKEHSKSSKSRLDEKHIKIKSSSRLRLDKIYDILVVLRIQADHALENGHIDHVLKNGHVNSSSKDELLDEDGSDIERTSIFC